MVSNLLLFLSIASTLFFLHSTILALYLIINTTLAFTACMSFPALRLSIFLILRQYSFIIISFISLLFTQSNCNTPRYLHPSLSFSDFIVYPFGNSIPSLCTTLPLFISKIAHLKIPNYIPTSLLKIQNVCTKQSSSCIVLLQSFKSSKKSKVINITPKLPEHVSCFCISKQYLDKRLKSYEKQDW